MTLLCSMMLLSDLTGEAIDRPTVDTVLVLVNVAMLAVLGLMVMKQLSKKLRKSGEATQRERLAASSSDIEETANPIAGKVE